MIDYYVSIKPVFRSVKKKTLFWLKRMAYGVSRNIEANTG